jgi:hypothetical protein
MSNYNSQKSAHLNLNETNNESINKTDLEAISTANPSLFQSTTKQNRNKEKREIDTITGGLATFAFTVFDPG